MHIHWQDKIPDTEVLKQADLPSIYTLLQKAQVRWAGHVSRMPDTRLPKQLLYSELSKGKRTVGGQKKRFKDSLKTSLKNLNIIIDSWESLAQDRPRWRSQIYSGAKTAEVERTTVAEKRRALRKARAASTSSATPTHSCPTSGRDFRARIGLISHLRTHQTKHKNPFPSRGHHQF